MQIMREWSTAILPGIALGVRIEDGEPRTEVVVEPGRLSELPEDWMLVAARAIARVERLIRWSLAQNNYHDWFFIYAQSADDIDALVARLWGGHQRTIQERREAHEKKRKAEARAERLLMRTIVTKDWPGQVDNTRVFLRRLTCYARSDGQCAYCHEPLTFVDGWHVDHVIPTSRGGSDKPDNTVASCANCNVVKGNMTGDEFRRYMSDRNKYRGLKSAHWRNA